MIKKYIIKKIGDWLSTHYSLIRLICCYKLYSEAIEEHSLQMVRDYLLKQYHSMASPSGVEISAKQELIQSLICIKDANGDRWVCDDTSKIQILNQILSQKYITGHFNYCTKVFMPQHGIFLNDDEVGKLKDALARDLSHLVKLIAVGTNKDIEDYIKKS